MLALTCGGGGHERSTATILGRRVQSERQLSLGRERVRRGSSRADTRAESAQRQPGERPGPSGSATSATRIWTFRPTRLVSCDRVVGGPGRIQADLSGRARNGWTRATTACRLERSVRGRRRGCGRSRPGSSRRRALFGSAVRPRVGRRRSSALHRLRSGAGRPPSFATRRSSSSTGTRSVPAGVSMVSMNGRMRRSKVERLMPSASAAWVARVGESLTRSATRTKVRSPVGAAGGGGACRRAFAARRC